MSTSNTDSPNKYYLPPHYSIKKLSWLGKTFETKVAKSDVYELINKSKDSKLKQTIEHIYQIRGDLLPFDLVLMRNELHQTLERHFDNKIRKQPSLLKDEDVEATQQAFESVKVMADKYKPKTEI